MYHSIMTGQPANSRAKQWLVWLCTCTAALGLGGSAWLIATDGVGVLGVNNAIPWGWDIVSFVFWIGLGHAGTLISAILLLSRQKWRGAIARHAELLTLCAIITASVFPLVHVGRAWMLWQLSPLPVASGVWPNLASALLWDAIAIGSYFVLSLLFWLIGMRGEQADMLPLQPTWGKICMGLATVLTVLVVTVHSVVGCDFAVIFRWHGAGIPPYFVCGALLSGMAAVQLIELSLKQSRSSTGAGCREKLSRLTLLFSQAMGLFYMAELWQEPHLLGWEYTIILILNVLLPGVYWHPAARQKGSIICAISMGILAGMWWERIFIIICRSEWYTGALYSPSWVDIAMLIGGISLFLALFLSISAHMPREQIDPAEAAQEPSSLRTGRIAALGGGCGATILLLWYSLTQWADTAGELSRRPLAYPYILPPLLVCTLLGAGLALSLCFFIRTRRCK